MPESINKKESRICCYLGPVKPRDDDDDDADDARCVRAVAKRRNAAWNRTSECRPPISEGLARQQRRLCTRNLDLMPAVVHSARQMAQVCQETFYESRWNCSSVLLAPRFMADLTGGRL